MSECKHKDMGEIEIWIDGCHDCGENEFDILKVKYEALQAENAELKAEVERRSEFNMFFELTRIRPAAQAVVDNAARYQSKSLLAVVRWDLVCNLAATLTPLSGTDDE